ncbi:MAG: Fic family protein, partial [Jiangellaceae bacterium]
VGARQLALAELGEAASRNAGIVAANVAVMTAAVDFADDITEQTILSMHATLLGEFDPRHAGEWRHEQVWVGGSNIGPHRADFVAIHHTRVPAAVADLVAFTRRVDLPVLPHAAIAHAQFETIHPFTDGNGRTGRALLHAIMHRARLARRVTVPLSAGLLTETSRYFEALLAYHDGDVVPIVQQVNEAAFAATSNGRRLAQDLADVRALWAGELRARRDAAAWRLLDLMIAQPVVTTRFVSERLGVSVPAAQNALDQLVDVGALRSAKDGKRRNRVWQADDVLVALDDFAARAGRRSRAR